jgi:lipopolysaccharide transport system permease protein
MVAFVDFLISFAILVALMIWYQFMLGWQILLLPLFAAIAFATSFGIGVCGSLRSTSNSETSVTSSRSLFMCRQMCRQSDSAPASSRISRRLVYSLNPMVGVIDGFRWCLLGGENELYLPGLWLSLAVTGFFVWFGIRQFRKMEKSFADLI